VFVAQSPFDFGIVSKRTRARAGYVDEHTIEMRVDWKHAGIGGDDTNIFGGDGVSPHAGGGWVELRRNDAGVGGWLGENSRLPTRCCAAVENVRSLTDEERDQLRSFVLDRDTAAPE